MSKQFIWIPESQWAMAPSLVVSAKPTDRRGIFNIIIYHPNTQEVLFSKNVRATDFLDALSKGKKIKDEQLSYIKTQYVETKIIPRPKRGKMKLNTKK